MSPTLRSGSSSSMDWPELSIPVIAIRVSILETFAIVAPVQFSIAELRAVVSRRVTVLAEVVVISTASAAGVVMAVLTAGVVTGIQSGLPQLIRAAELAITIPITSAAIIIIIIAVSITVAIAIVAIVAIIA